MFGMKCWWMADKSQLSTFALNKMRVLTLPNKVALLNIKNQPAVIVMIV